VFAEGVQAHNGVAASSMLWTAKLSAGRGVRTASVPNQQCLSTPCCVSRESITCVWVSVCLTAMLVHRCMYNMSSPPERVVSIGLAVADTETRLQLTLRDLNVQGSSGAGNTHDSALSVVKAECGHGALHDTGQQRYAALRMLMRL